MTEQQYFAKPRWQGTEDVVWLVLAEGAFLDVQLKKLCSAGCLLHERGKDNLEVSQLRQGRVSEPQLGEGTQQSSPPAFHS